jgi:hypothetical protein
MDNINYSLHIKNLIFQMINMKDWKKNIQFDPFPKFLSTQKKAIIYFTRRDLLNEKVYSIEKLWKLPIPLKIIDKQQEDGSWKYPCSKKDIRTQENYDQLETYRQIGFLIEKHRIQIY